MIKTLKQKFSYWHSLEWILYYLPFPQAPHFISTDAFPCVFLPLARLTQSESHTGDQPQAPESYDIVQECRLISKQLKQALESCKACGIHTRQHLSIPGYVFHHSFPLPQISAFSQNRQCVWSYQICVYCFFLSRHFSENRQRINNN